MFTRATVMFALLFALPACGYDGDNSDTLILGEDAGSEASGFDGGDEETGEPPEDDDNTGTTGEEVPPPELVRTCDLPIPCEEPVELVRESGSDGYSAGDLCAFAALGSEAPGLIQTVAAFATAESYFDHVVIGPGEVLRQANGRSDSLGYWQKPVERCVLKAPQYFAACANSFDPSCLDPEQWVRSCEALGSLTCPQA